MWPALIAGAAAIGSSVIGANEASKGRQQAADLLRKAQQLYGNIDLPDIDKMKLMLQNPELVGEYDPELLMAIEMAPSEYDSISTDPLLEQQQMDALQQMSELSEGGLSERDKAAAREIRRSVAQDDAARRASVLQNMAQRGVLGSGMELAAQLDSAQDSAEAQSRASDELIKQAQDRALQALSQSSQMAGDIRSQSFDEQAQKARAKDAINQWNTSNRQSIMNQNTQNQNQAQLANLQARQALENERAKNANVQQQYNKNLYQQQFDNRMARAGAQANVISGAANLANQSGKDQAAMIGGVGSGLANMFGSFAKGK